MKTAEYVKILVSDIASKAQCGSAVSINCEGGLSEPKPAADANVSGTEQGTGKERDLKGEAEMAEKTNISFTTSECCPCKVLSGISELILRIMPYVAIIWLGHYALEVAKVVKGCCK